MNYIPTTRTERVIIFRSFGRVFCATPVTEKHLRIGSGIAASAADGYFYSGLINNQRTATIAEL